MNESDYNYRINQLESMVKHLFLMTQGDQKIDLIVNLLELAARISEIGDTSLNCYLNMAEDSYKRVKAENWLRIKYNIE